jgi:hypothetical protein
MTPTPPSVADHAPLLRAVAAYGLPGTLHELPGEPLPDGEFEALHAAVRTEKLSGLLWWAISDDAFPVTARQREQVEEWHLRVLSACLLLEELLVETVTALREAGIPARALKGTAMAHLDYPDPSCRTFVDVDLLVPGAQFGDAVKLLEARGRRRRYPEARPGFDAVYGKGVCLTADDGLELDLHRTFAMGPFGLRLDLDKVWSESQRFTLAGEAVEALTVEARLLHAAYHAVLGSPRPGLAPLRDIAQILLTWELDWVRLQDLMQASHGRAVVARGIRLAWSELWLADVLRATAWAESYQESAEDTRFLTAYGEGSTYATQQLAAVKALPNMSQRIDFVRTLVRPAPSYLDGRHRGRLRRLRHGLADLRRWRASR